MSNPSPTLPFSISPISSYFSTLNHLFDSESQQRDSLNAKLREFHNVNRQLSLLVSKIHTFIAEESSPTSPSSSSSLSPPLLVPSPSLCSLITHTISSSLPPLFNEIFFSSSPPLINIVTEYDKFQQNFSFLCQNFTFLLTFSHFVTKQTLLPLQECEKIIFGEKAVEERKKGKISMANQSKFPQNQHPSSSSSSSTSTSPSSPPSPSLSISLGLLDVDDYLQGVCLLPKELHRLCLNSVRHDNYVLPLQINDFLSDLYSGFKLLNLRNDALRRKFDTIKYDTQGVEQILYDMKVRKLGSGSTTATDKDKGEEKKNENPMEM